MDQERSNQQQDAEPKRFRAPSGAWLAAGIGLAGVLAWAFWPTLEQMAERWSRDARYSHGYLVPAFAAFLLWFRRDKIPAEGFRPHWSGLALVMVGIALFLAGGRYFFGWLDALALLPVVAGLAVVAGGWPALNWAWPSVLFLVFMLPLPYRLEVGFANPLQRTATLVSTYILQTVGFSAVDRGNIILVKDLPPIGVEEACSGLSMLITFCALSTAMAFVLQRPLVDKLVVLLSAVPIALLANVARIVAYVVLYRTVGAFWAEDFFHQRAGWLMMPLALALLWIELRLLSALLVEAEPDDAPPLDMLAGLAGTR